MKISFHSYVKQTELISITKTSHLLTRFVEEVDIYLFLGYFAHIVRREGD